MMIVMDGGGCDMIVTNCGELVLTISLQKKTHSTYP